MNNPQKIFDIKCLPYYEGDFSEYEPFILFRFIFQKKQSYKSWVRQHSQFQQNCSALISDKELSFQCFTCGNEAAHIYCKECFDPQQHLGHQCIINGKSKGLCDCGCESIISKQGFCLKHQTQVLDRNEEIRNIPINLQKKITHILQSFIGTFISLMKQIKNYGQKFNYTLLTFYHFAKQKQDQGLMKIIEKQYPIVSIYTLIKRASNIHTLIFNTIDSLIHQSYSYQVFIQKILSNKSCENSKYTVMEKILKYQVYLEPYQDFKIMKIDKILYSLYTDEKFKAFLFAIMLKNFSKLWLIDQFRINNDDSKINFKNLTQINCYEYVNQFISTQHNDSNLIHYVYISNILITESQFVSYEMQKQFFSQNQNIQDLIVTMERLHYTSGALCSQSQLALPQLFRRRFEYKAFRQIASDQLKEILNTNFDQFTKEDIKINLIKEFNYKKFAITTLINSLGQGIEMKNQSKQWNQEIILADTVHYIIDQATYYSAICVGLKNLFNSSYSNEMFQNNIIKLLFYQTYFILKKTFLNDQINKQIIGFYNSDYEDLQQIKNGMIIQKLFISYLGYLNCSTQFQSGGQFLNFLLDILDENEQEFENLLNSLLDKIVFVYLIIHSNSDENGNEKLQKVYQGTENNIEYSQFHRVDTCLFKLYIFLYGVKGFSRFQHQLEQFQKQKGKKRDNVQTGRIQQLFIDMILTDLDLYNVCSPLLTNLSNDLKLTLARIAGNYFILSNQMEYGDMLGKLQNSGVLITQNFPSHILEICEVDQTTKKLKLKAEYQIFYEPSLLQNEKGLNTEIIERLIEKQKSEREILLGNGIIWDIEQFSNQRYRVLQHSLLKNYCHFKVFMQNLECLKRTPNCFQGICQLIYAQLVFFQYFDQILFNNFAEIVKVELEEIYYLIFKKKNQKQITLLISSINELNKSQIEENKQTKLKFQAQKDKYKAKFNKISSSNLISQILNKEQQQEIAIKDENLCYACKLSLNAQNSVGTLSIFVKPQSQNDDATLEKLQNLFHFNLILGVSTCKHYFHDKCLTKSFQSKYIRNYDFGNSNLDLNCPVCKQTVIQRFPIDEIDEQKLKSFNSDLLMINYHLNFYFEKHQPIKLVQIYISIFFDLVTSLFINPEKYRRDQKNVVFKQLLTCFYETIQEMDQNSRTMLLPQMEIPKQQNNLALNTMRSICNILTNQYSLNELRFDIIDLVGRNRQLSKEEMSLFASSFEIEEEIIEQQLNAQLNVSEEDKTLNYYQTFQRQTIQQVYNKLGQTFLQFHSKYFSEKCHLCNFDAKTFSYSGISVCLLCQKVFCNQSCIKKNQNNLIYHAFALHEGNSIFVSLQDSSVTLISKSKSSQKFKSLYYNNLGERINSENPHSDWNTYMLDVTKANELALIILNDMHSKVKKI